MTLETTIAQDQKSGREPGFPAGSAARARSTTQPFEPRLARTRRRGIGGTLALGALILVGGPLAVAVASVAFWLAIALAGPFFLSGILVLAVVFVALLATGASG